MIVLSWTLNTALFTHIQDCMLYIYVYIFVCVCIYIVCVCVLLCIYDKTEFSISEIEGMTVWCFYLLK